MEVSIHSVLGNASDTADPARETANPSASGDGAGSDFQQVLASLSNSKSAQNGQAGSGHAADADQSPEGADPAEAMVEDGAAKDQTAEAAPAQAGEPGRKEAAVKGSGAKPANATPGTTAEADAALPSELASELVVAQPASAAPAQRVPTGETPDSLVAAQRTALQGGAVPVAQAQVIRAGQISQTLDNTPVSPQTVPSTASATTAKTGLVQDLIAQMQSAGGKIEKPSADGTGNTAPLAHTHPAGAKAFADVQAIASRNSALPGVTEAAPGRAALSPVPSDTAAQVQIGKQLVSGSSGAHALGARGLSPNSTSVQQDKTGAGFAPATGLVQADGHIRTVRGGPLVRSERTGGAPGAPALPHQAGTPNLASGVDTAAKQGDIRLPNGLNPSAAPSAGQSTFQSTEFATGPDSAPPANRETVASNAISTGLTIRTADNPAPTAFTGAEPAIQTARTAMAGAEQLPIILEPGMAEAQTGPFAAEARPASAASPAQVVRADAPSMPAQLADILVQHSGRRVDVALSPEELGQVRLSMSFSDTGATVLVVADRPETLDLMRRHAEALADALRALGHETVGFEFQRERSETPESKPDIAGADEDLLTPTPDTQPPVAAPPTAGVRGLDIRL